MNQTSMSKYSKLIERHSDEHFDRAPSAILLPNPNVGTSHLLQLAGLKRLHVSVRELNHNGCPEADY